MLIKMLIKIRGGGGLPQENDGAAGRKFSKNTLKGMRIWFDGRGSNRF